MARYTEAVCRLCRREGMKLFLKGDRCFKEKCAIERRDYPPGQHGQRRSKLLGYGIQLREKQKVKRIYGLLESQFRLTSSAPSGARASRARTCSRCSSGAWTTSSTRSGFAASRAQARQLVRHGHVTVNGRKVTIPSYRRRQGPGVAIKEKSRANEQIKASVETRPGARRARLAGSRRRRRSPGRSSSCRSAKTSSCPIQEQLIVELYSK